MLQFRHNVENDLDEGDDEGGDDAEEEELDLDLGEADEAHHMKKDEGYHEMDEGYHELDEMDEMDE